jgi:hypothetical protein
MQITVAINRLLRVREERLPAEGVFDLFCRFTRDPIGMEKVELRFFSANLRALAGIALLMMLSISTNLHVEL